MPEACRHETDPGLAASEGASRNRRMPEALRPSYVSVDERTLEEGIAFAKAYAQHVRFFMPGSTGNTAEQDWSPFFGDDPTVLLAETSLEDVDAYKKQLKGFFDLLKKRNPLPPEETLRKNLGYLFSAAASLVVELDRLKLKLPSGSRLKEALRTIIERQLATSLRQLVAAFKAGRTIKDETRSLPGGLIGTEMAPGKVLFHRAFIEFEHLLDTSLSVDWIPGKKPDEQRTWKEYASSIEQEPAWYGATSTVHDMACHIASHNLFTGIFDQLVKAYALAVSGASSALREDLLKRDDHQPHYALYLAFLRLAGFIRKDLNTLTGSHLDFYYRDVLRLHEKPALPNHAHVVIGLAKNRDSHLLTRGTELSAGKDRLGKEIVYALDEDFAPNTAVLHSVKAVCRSGHKLFAFPVANSLDGKGEKPIPEGGHWAPFPQSVDEQHLATVGFCISSHCLLLREGKRMIRLTLVLSGTPSISAKEFCKAFTFHLTGEKEWIPATSIDKLLSSKPVSTMEIYLQLDGNLPPVVAPAEYKEQPPVPDGLPALRATLDQQADLPPETLKAIAALQLKPADSRIEVCVGYNTFNSPRPNGQGLKELHLLTKFGEARPGKPFLPFGPMPARGDALIIGCDEAFQKNGAYIQLHVVWKGLPDWRGDMDFDWIGSFYPKVNVSVLENGMWNTLEFDDRRMSRYSIPPGRTSTSPLPR